MRHSRGSDSTPPLDARIAALAQRQHGVVSARQMNGLGVERGAIAHRVKTGRLHRIHRGVYAPGHPHPLPQRAVHGRGAQRRRRRRHQPRRGDPPPRPARLQREQDRRQLTAAHPGERHDQAAPDADPRTARRHRPSTASRSRPSPAPSWTSRRPRPSASSSAPSTRPRSSASSTSPPWTTSSPARAVAPRSASSAALERHRDGPSLTRSELEEAFLALVERAGLPRPRINARVCGFEVDAYWPEHRLRGRGRLVPLPPLAPQLRVGPPPRHRAPGRRHPHGARHRPPDRVRAGRGRSGSSAACRFRATPSVIGSERRRTAPPRARRPQCATCSSSTATSPAGAT